jgi:aspartyl-tRNA(Asn)/glutamyl-tRNA(Gln) amidotransferase subunit A
VTAHSESELAFMSIEQARRLLRRKEISPVDLVDAALARIKRSNERLYAFLTVLPESARRQARLAERAMRGAQARGALFGIPVSLKDNFQTRGIRTTAGSKILADWVPQQDSEVAGRLGRAGAILLGKTNMHEFAYGITGENQHYGSSRNPWAPDRISGGSSGGSAAAVATGMGFASVGTDTGGSIRIPSALCGIVGLKPTFGLVSCEGVVPLARSFDHAGPMARTVADACILLEAIAGKYPSGEIRPDYRTLRKARPRRFRVGWPKDYFFDKVDAEVLEALEAAAKTLASLGASVEEVSLPHLAAAIDQATSLVVAEASHYHESRGYFPALAAEYDADVRDRLQLGHRLLAVDYLAGFAKRKQVEDDFAAALRKVDVILAPTSPIAATPVGARRVELGGRPESVRPTLLRLGRPANLTGLPALSIPCGFTSDRLPVGMQLIGPRWGEARMLAIAGAYEEATEWHRRHPDFI